MAILFSDVKKGIEVAVIMAADENKIPHCVEGTGDLIKSGKNFVDAFEYEHDWFMFSVEEDALNKITVGSGVSRIYGSLVFTVYSPNGQGGSGGAKITDFIYSNLHASRIERTLLRNVRTIGKFNLKGWKAKILQVSFEHTVSAN